MRAIACIPSKLSLTVDFNFIKNKLFEYSRKMNQIKIARILIMLTKNRILLKVLSIKQLDLFSNTMMKAKH